MDAHQGFPICDESFECAKETYYECDDCSVYCGNYGCFNTKLLCINGSCLGNCVGSYSCYNMNGTVLSQSIMHLNCFVANYSCYSQAWYVYGTLKIECSELITCYFMKLFLFSGGNLILQNYGYLYKYSDIILFTGSYWQIDFDSVEYLYFNNN